MTDQNENINIKQGITEIVEELSIQADSRDRVNELVDKLHKSTGYKKPLIRKAANLLFKDSMDELDEDSEILKEILSKL